MRIGVTINRISEFDLGHGSHGAEFWVTFSWPQEDGESPGDLFFVNGRNVQVDVLSEEPGKKELTVTGEFLEQVDLSDFPFDTQELVLEVRDMHGTLVNDLVYEIDTEWTFVSTDVRLPGWEMGELKSTGEDPGPRLRR